ncbi:LysR family transcriptional regulator [Corynebacterium sp. 3HC-13]|uniref:LysR family transcriptional regulator n=1 Tax=Corynebacterium poyangense TaxID=2684405 RepID=UPI001CCCE910|nr:LysR substrate-binding domain-containing protein [Corynebacterium poyangense]MBZ8178300.1 LysR family transcriptional regulator [Corynebacterium poyangense]
MVPYPRIDSFWLEAFLAVAEDLHFGKASQRLSIGQSPLSQIIKRLERQLGVALFDRSTRQVRLTPAGHAFLSDAQSLLFDLRLGVERAQLASGEIHGAIRVSFSGFMNHSTLPSLVVQVRNRYPNIELQCTHRLLSGEAISALENDLVDIAFIGLPVTSPLISTLPIAAEQHFLLIPENHPLRELNRKSCRFEELKEEKFITTPADQGSTLRRILDNTAQNAGWEPTVVHEVADAALVMAFVSRGLGVAMVPECLQQVKPKRTVAIPIEDVPPLHSALAWRSGNESQVVAAVIECAKETWPS